MNAASIKTIETWYNKGAVVRSMRARVKEPINMVWARNAQAKAELSFRPVVEYLYLPWESEEEWSTGAVFLPNGDFMIGTLDEVEEYLIANK